MKDCNSYFKREYKHRKVSTKKEGQIGIHTYSFAIHFFLSSTAY